MNITFRLLYNGHISMTGGQGIPGTLGVTALTKELEAIGVREIVVVSERPDDLEGFPETPGSCPNISW